MSKSQLTVIFQLKIVRLRRRRGDRSCSGRGLRGFGLRLLDEVGQLGLESPDFDGQNVGDFRTLRRLAETLQLVDVGASLEFIHEIHLQTELLQQLAQERVNLLDDRGFQEGIKFISQINGFSRKWINEA